MLISSPATQRECLAPHCGKKLPLTARLDMLFCGSRCRSREWARANTPQSLAIKEADFAEFQADMLRRAALIKGAVGYSLARTCPTRERAGLVWFPQPSRKTKRFPRLPGGRFRFVRSAYFSLTPFECPRVPLVGSYCLRFHRQDGSEINVGTLADVVVKAAFPAVRFYDKDGGDYDPRGRPVKPRTRKTADKREQDKPPSNVPSASPPPAPQMPQRPQIPAGSPAPPSPRRSPQSSGELEPRVRRVLLGAAKTATKASKRREAMRPRIAQSDSVSRRLRKPTLCFVAKSPVITGRASPWVVKSADSQAASMVHTLCQVEAVLVRDPRKDERSAFSGILTAHPSV